MTLSLLVTEQYLHHISLEEAEEQSLRSPQARMVLYCTLNEQLLTAQGKNKIIKGLAFCVSLHKWEQICTIRMSGTARLW